MLETLKLVGLTCGSGFENSHLSIKKSRATAFNGQISISSPIDFDIDCCPDYKQLSKALAVCKETIEMSMLKSGRLRIKSGKFKFFIDCLEPGKIFASEVSPQGQMLKLNNLRILENVKKIIAFANTDNVNLWSNGLLFNNQSIYATNNNALVEMWTGQGMPDGCNVPAKSLAKLIKINKSPNILQFDDKSLTFHYENGIWFKTQLIDKQWPDVSSILNSQDEAETIDSSFFTDLSKLKTMISNDGIVYFKKGKIKTCITSDMGAEIEGISGSLTGAYSYKNLAMLEGLVTKIDFGKYPDPAKFYGEGLRGVIVGAKI